MTIIATRIDGRLIHGQVANLWTPKLNISRIIVVDDEVAENDVEKMGLRMATPAGVKLSVLPVERAAENLKAGRYNSQKVFIVSKKPTWLRQLVEKGVEIPTINVGNMSKTDDSISITKSVNVEKEDLADFKAIHDAGVKLITQMVPGDTENNFYELIQDKL
jgi:PTS system mannose-specific IIB component